MLTVRNTLISILSIVLVASIVVIAIIPRVLGLDVLEQKEVASSLPVVASPLDTEKITLLFFGDMMLDRHVALTMDRYGSEYPFLYTKELFKSADFVIANAEGVFSPNLSVTKGVSQAPLRFTFATSTLPELYNLGFSAFSQANNHNADFGKTGSDYSHEAIKEAGIEVFGDFWNERVGPVYLEKGNQKVALVGFNEFSYTGTASVEAAIKKAKETGAYVVVFPHWGVEYNQDISTLQQTYAHRFIDRGADLVVGAHPHVIEPIEVYKGRAIFYSLGNFIFDQYQPHTQEALGVKVELLSDKTIFTLIPLALSIGQAQIAEGDKKEGIFNFLKTATGTSSTIREGVGNGFFVLPQEAV